MKKLLYATILLITSFGYLQAQSSKSDKDDVIASLNKITKSTIGKKFERTGVVKETIVSFTKYKSLLTSEDDNSTTKEEYIKIKWENLDPVLKGKAGYNDEDIIKIRLYFTSKVKSRKTFSTTNEKEDADVSTVEIFIPAKEFENVWQTCQRLAEIAREENKDPNRFPVVEEEFDIDPVKTTAVTAPVSAQIIDKPEKTKAVKPEPGKTKPKVSKNSKVTAEVISKQEDTKPVAPPVIAEPPAVFSLDNSTEYYYVVNVLDPSVNLSPSRFRIGQLNRMNFPDSGIKHELQEVNKENQLIVVGLFPNKKDLLDYYKHINPVLSQLMKIKGGTYNAFYVSKQNLDKLSSREKIEQYVDFFKKNFNPL